MRLSVIVPAYNEETLIAGTLARIRDSLEANRRPDLSYELIVCDNNSSDRTAEKAAAAGARVVAEPINQISRARNAGAAAATGDWLLFIDADTYPSPSLVADLLDHLRSGEVLGCGATIEVEGGSRLNKLRLERLNPVYRLIQMSGGAFLALHAESFRVVGGFSEDLHALEEVDFLLRFKRYARRQGKRFRVLTRHPVVTSGRKDELSVRSLFILFLSNLVALLYFALYLLLPRKLLPKLGKPLLRYWYPDRR